jgi:ornithine cyclodeaminase/alanine dehydrogenase-like protein (mu-crystallin family)
MTEDSVLYLSRKDVMSTGLSMGEIIEALDAMFLEKGNGKVEMPPKPGIHTQPDAFIHAMPAYIPSLGTAGMKWVSGYPANQEKGLPYISGLLILNNPENGIPICVMDCAWVTAMRTGAATAVAAKYLARSESSSVGIVACGVQGRGNLEALSCIFNITKVKVFDMYPELSKGFSKEMGERLGLDIEPVAHLREAVEGMDIVVTSGPILKKPKPAIGKGWFPEGAFVCPLDFDSYLDGDAFREADKLATDDLGQMRFYREEGYFGDTPECYADLGEIVSGSQPGRESDEERIIAINLGLGLEDMATAILVYQSAIDQGIGTMLPL